MNEMNENQGRFSGNAEPEVQEVVQQVQSDVVIPPQAQNLVTEPKKLGVGARIGYFFLALVPIITCFTLQFIISLIVLVGVILEGVAAGAVNMADMAAYMEFVMQAALDTSPMITGIYHVVSSIVFFVWYFFTFKKPRPTVKSTFQWFSGKSVLVVAIVGIVLNLMANGTVVLESIFTPSIVESYMQLAEIAGLGTDPFVIFAAICLAPIGEEFVCRGLTLKFAEKSFGKFWVANVMQAIIFGIMHANWVQGIYAFLIGLALGYMTKRYKSIVPAMICHFVINFSSSTWIPYVLEPVPANVFTGLLLTILPIALTIWLFVWDSNKKTA